MYMAKFDSERILPQILPFVVPYHGHLARGKESWCARSHPPQVAVEAGHPSSIEHLVLHLQL